MAKGFKLAWYPSSLIIVLLWLFYIAGMIVTLELAVAYADASIPFLNDWDWLPKFKRSLHHLRPGAHARRRHASRPSKYICAPRPCNLTSDMGRGLLACGSQLAGSYRFCGDPLGTASAQDETILNIHFVRDYHYARPSCTHHDLASIPCFHRSIRTTHLDIQSQLAVGSGAWTTNLTVQRMYGARTYLPEDDAHEANIDVDMHDLVFAGDLQSMSANVTSIRLTGGCARRMNLDARSSQGLRKCSRHAEAIFRCHVSFYGHENATDDMSQIR
jgi:hypothetical protein